jgi:hypothetical protein
MKFILLSLLLSLSTFANDNCIKWQETTKFKNKLIIGQINLNVANVFDLAKAKESRKFHKIANKLHITTKENIIARELLFAVGDIYDERLIKETARLIREKPFIKDVDIFPTEVCGNQVTIAVETNDNWTLEPGISFGRTGGKTKYAFELQEKNLFGFGKSLELKYRKGLDRTQRSIKYNDNNLFGTHNRLDAIYEDNSDGTLKFVNYYRPFFSLDTERTWKLEYLDNELITPLYERGKVLDEIGQIHKVYNIDYGKLVKRTQDSVHRITLGFTSDESTFFNSEDYPQSEIPNSRDYKYPWVKYEYFYEDYIIRNNFNTMGRQEDVSLGSHFTGQLGSNFSDSSQHFNFTYDKGFYDQDNDLILLNSYFNGIYDNSNLRNSHVGATLKWFHFQGHNKTFYIEAQVDKAENLFLENRQYLGGDTGLRGYPFRYLQGENKILLTVEQRFFYNWYPLKTLQFASAVFVDSGAAWNSDVGNNQVTDVGVGFRLIPTRTSSGRVLHFDIAIPINDRDVVGSWQIQLRTKQSF